MRAQIVSFHCVLKDKLGRVISSSFNQDVVNQLDKGTETLRGLAEGLQNVTEGERREIFVPADQAYGYYDPKLVVKVPRRELSQGAQLDVGSEVVARSGSNDGIQCFRVVKAEDEHVVLDGNHPLAGQDLFFEVEVIAAREASEEDLAETEAHELPPNIH